MQRIYVFVVLFVLISTCVFAETDRLISEKNQYGGKSFMVTYSPGDAEYKEIEKTIYYYDRNGKRVKIEPYGTSGQVKKTGIAKSMIYLDSNEKPQKAENYYTNENISKSGIAKSVAYLDSNGNLIKQEDYDKNGKLLKTGR